MDKVIPILPCPDIKTQVAFYQALGFEVLALYTSPYPYACLQRGTIELHFYGNRKILPGQNPFICYLNVEQVDVVYNAFQMGLKNHLGKIPRSDIPRLSNVRDLSQDRRFTLIDMGGNTLYIGTPLKPESDNFFRTLQNTKWAQSFTVLYDMLYSKEDELLAQKMLPKFLESKAELNALDQAKLFLVVLDVQKQLGQPVVIHKLNALLENHPASDQAWMKVKERYSTLLQKE